MTRDEYIKGIFEFFEEEDGNDREAVDKFIDAGQKLVVELREHDILMSEKIEAIIAAVGAAIELGVRRYAEYKSAESTTPRTLQVGDRIKHQSGAVETVVQIVWPRVWTEDTASTPLIAPGFLDFWKHENGDPIQAE